LYDPLLVTKFNIPPIRAGLVARPRLLRSLNSSLNQPLSIITAPPGFGKTTLLSDWVRSYCEDQRDRGVLFAWISLDEDDNTPDRFWTYLLTGLQKAVEASSLDPSICKAFASITSMLANASPYQSFLTALINEITSLPVSVILVLDDYHVIQDPIISQSVTYLVDHCPANLHLVISSRTDPPLPLARWRMCGQLNSLRAQDLRFSLDEAIEFLNTTMGLSLSLQNVAELDQRTEGWPAGLQMAAFTLQNLDETGVAQAIATFSGRHHFLLDYFTSEILQRQPAETQHFLLRTAVLDRMCAGLCAAVLNGDLGGESMCPELAQAILERLEHANLFVLPLDSERAWYRYHHLFNDLLLARLQQSVGPQGIATLRCRAAAWHAQQGNHTDAIQLALQAAEYNLAADLLDNSAHSEMLWESGKAGMMLRWIQQLPAGVVMEHPWLRLYQARAAYFSNQPALMDAILAEIEQKVRVEPDRVPNAEALLGSVLAHQGRFASFRGQVEAAVGLSNKALEIIPENEKNTRAFILSTLAVCATQSGEEDKILPLFEQSTSLYRQSGSRFISISAQATYAIQMIGFGSLREAIRISTETIQEGLILGNLIPVTGWAHFPLAEALFEQNRLSAAEKAIREGLRLVAEGQLSDYFGLMPALLARILFASGQVDESQAWMESALATSSSAIASENLRYIQSYQVHQWVQMGVLDRATRWVEAYRQRAEGEVIRDLEQLTLAEVLLATGQVNESLRLLSVLGEKTLSHTQYATGINLRILKAWAHHALGDEPGALHELRRALDLGEPEGYIRPFVSRGELIAGPLRQMLGENVSPGPRAEYILRILEAFPQKTPARRPQEGQHPALLAPLTPREMDVLRLLAVGLSNREIAEKLYLSPNTLRVYTTNLYSKMDVHNRTQAVTRAQMLGLI
jgi:LuxR family maltose regulon positive regulatory protein